MERHKENKASKGSDVQHCKCSRASKHSMKAIKPLWLGSGSPAKTLTKALTEEASSRAAGAVLGEITSNLNIIITHLHPQKGTIPLAYHLSDHNHSSTPPPVSFIAQENQPTPLSSSYYPSANSPYQKTPQQPLPKTTCSLCIPTCSSFIPTCSLFISTCSLSALYAYRPAPK